MDRLVKWVCGVRRKGKERKGEKKEKCRKPISSQAKSRKKKKKKKKDQLYAGCSEREESVYIYIL